MKRLLSLTAAAALSVAALAGATSSSLALETGPNAVRNAQPGNYIVLRIESLDGDTAQTIQAAASVNANAVQAAIRANPDLVRSLQAKNVQIGNVVEAQAAMNGGVTFYLR